MPTLCGSRRPQQPPRFTSLPRKQASRSSPSWIVSRDKLPATPEGHELYCNRRLLKLDHEHFTGPFQAPCCFPFAPIKLIAAFCPQVPETTTLAPAFIFIPHCTIVSTPFREK